MENLGQLINSVVKLPGLNRSFIPSLRTLRRHKPEIDRFFTSLLEPEQTYSGFRVSLVFAIKYVAYILFGLTDLRGLEVDIWGDGVEIGKLDMTRFAFRFREYKEPKISRKLSSAQSDKAVFTFAIFRGHDSRFILENNIGCSVLGKPETGWLYQQTEQLNQMGIKVTYSGDQPFLLRLIMGISKVDSNENTSKKPLYVGRNDSH